MSIKEKVHIVGLIILPILSIPFGFFVFRYSGFPALFLPMSMILILFFAFLWTKTALGFRILFNIIKTLRELAVAYCLMMFVFAPLCWLLAYLNFNFFSEKVRFPMSQVEWISVNKDGAIYCFSFSYLRIQVFDSDGKFCRGWFVRRPPAPYQMSLTEDNNIVFGDENGKPLYCYDSYGNSREPPEKDKIIFTPMRTRKTIDKNGNIYELRHLLIRPYIAKIYRDGSELNLIKDPIGLWIHTYPILLVFFAIGFVVYFTVPIISLETFGNRMR